MFRYVFAFKDGKVSVEEMKVESTKQSGRDGGVAPLKSDGENVVVAAIPFNAEPTHAACSSSNKVVVVVVVVVAIESSSPRVAVQSMLSLITHSPQSSSSSKTQLLEAEAELVSAVWAEEVPRHADGDAGGRHDCKLQAASHEAEYTTMKEKKGEPE